MITISRSQLQSVLASAFAMTPGRTPREILKSVLLTVTRDGLKFHANDSESGIFFQIPMEVSDYGKSLLIPPPAFALIRGLSDDEVTLEVSESSLVIACDSGRWEFLTEDPSSFPAMDPLREGIEVTISARQLRDAIARAIPHTDDDSSRYALGGVCLDFQNSAVVATDGRRLAVTRCDFSESEASGKSVIPERVAKVIVRELDCECDDTVTLRVSNHAVTFTLPESVIYTRVIEGRFPDWTAVVPESVEHECKVHAGELSKALKLVSVVSNEESVGCDLLFEGGYLSLSASGSSVGSSQMRIPCTMGGDSLMVRMNPAYMQACLPVQEQVSIGGDDSNSAVLIAVDDRTTYVVMPLAVED